MNLLPLVVPPRLHAMSGRTLKLQEPISFWGGVSPNDGRLTDPRSRTAGQCIAGRLLFIEDLRGSSSGSSILLELAYRGVAPLAIVLTAADAILALGALVAIEMQWQAPALYSLERSLYSSVPDGVQAHLSPEGELRWS